MSIVIAKSDHCGLYGKWAKGDELDTELAVIQRAVENHPSLFVGEDDEVEIVEVEDDDDEDE